MAVTVLTAQAGESVFEVANNSTDVRVFVNGSELVQDEDFTADGTYVALTDAIEFDEDVIVVMTCVEVEGEIGIPGNCCGI